jgi:hypothetical protein
MVRRGFHPVTLHAASPAGGERAWDEKSVARRAHGLMVATWEFACLRRIFTAQALHRPLAYQGGIIIFKHRKLEPDQAKKINLSQKA